MVQITATITEEVVKMLDLSASYQGISRSKWIALAIEAYLASGAKDEHRTDHRRLGKGPDDLQDAEVQDTDAAQSSDVYLEKEHLREEVQRLMHEVESKNQVIRLQSDEISWLRGECAKITDRMLLALPPPRQHWWEFWKRQT